MYKIIAQCYENYLLIDEIPLNQPVLISKLKVIIKFITCDETL
jgi:hypothetical protein